MQSIISAMVVFISAVAFAAATADAAGCIKGAIVGGAAGHFAGHGKLGAAAGCVIGHHRANKQQSSNSAQSGNEK